MVHLKFNRPVGKIVVYSPTGAVASDSEGEFVFEAGGDAWGAPGYGHDGWCPPGHYLLGPIETFDPIASEGAAQIYVTDMDDTTAEQLIAKDLAQKNGQLLIIGGIAARVGQLANYGRAGIMIHGGGSNAPDPQAPYQELCKTVGCTRLHNHDLGRLVTYLRAQIDGNKLVYSIVGDPLTLSC